MAMLVSKQQYGWMVPPDLRFLGFKAFVFVVLSLRSALPTCILTVQEVAYSHKLLA